MATNDFSVWSVGSIGRSVDMMTRARRKACATSRAQLEQDLRAESHQNAKEQKTYGSLGRLGAVMAGGHCNNQGHVGISSIMS
jgi:hypothetical protein